MINNFDLLARQMSFESTDDFYFVSVLVRKKDGRKFTPDGCTINGNNKNRTIRIWTIRSVEEFNNAKDDIMNICNATGARAYFYPTKRSFKNVAKECMRISTESFVTENYQGMKRAFSSACGISFNSKDKKWIVDIDEKDELKVAEISLFIDNECDDKLKKKFLYAVPTVHGFHLICKPFNLKTFSDKYPEIDVHKNNPTLLYYGNQ